MLHPMELNEETCSPTALGRDPASAACPIVSSSASPSKAGTPETGAGKTLGLCGASSGVGGTFLTASASSSLRGAETKGAGVGGAIPLAKINWEPKEAYENCQGQVFTWLIISPFHAFGNLLILRVTNSWLLPGTATMLTSLLIVFPSQMPFVHCGAPLADCRRYPKTHSPNTATRPL